MRTHTIVIYRIKMTQGEALAYDWTEAFKLPFNWVYKELKGQLSLL